MEVMCWCRSALPARTPHTLLLSYGRPPSSSILFLKHSTYFGGFIDDDIRDICKHNYFNSKSGSSVLKRLDHTIAEAYRDSTCLLAVFSPQARQHLELRIDEEKLLQRVQTSLHLQPSVWDMQAVSLLVQGLEKEYTVGEKEKKGGGQRGDKFRFTLRPTTRFRHEQKPAHASSAPDSDKSQQQTPQRVRKTSLARRSGRVDAVFHARAEVVFDSAEAREYHPVPPEDSSSSSSRGSLQKSRVSLCDYINTTALSDKDEDKDSVRDKDSDSDDVFQCLQYSSRGRGHSNNNNNNNNKRQQQQRQEQHSSALSPRLASSTRFVHRLLSSGVKVAYLSAELFGEK